jgi:hypothetical protein
VIISVVYLLVRCLLGCLTVLTRAGCPRTPSFWWCATRRCLFRMEVEDLCLLAVVAVR